MPLIYTLVKRKDMSKDAASGATLYHAQTSITKKLTLNKICTRIENICTASRGEIILVLDGLIKATERKGFSQQEKDRQNDRHFQGGGHSDTPRLGKSRVTNNSFIGLTNKKTDDATKRRS